MPKDSAFDREYEQWKEKLKNKRVDIVDQCVGCDRIEEGTSLCSVYVNPAERWKLGTCPLATHIITRVETKPDKVRVGQQKQKRKK